MVVGVGRSSSRGSGREMKKREVNLGNVPKTSPDGPLPT